MMKNRFRLFKLRDLTVIISALALAAVGFLSWIPGGGSPTAVIEQNGKEILREELDKITAPKTIDLDGDIKVTVLLENGKASIISSECFDKICVETGVLTKPGQCAVCLPARVSVRIIGENKSGIDGFTG